MTRLLLLSTLLLAFNGLFAQEQAGLANALQQVERNNLDLIAARAHQAGDRVAARTGLSPTDPHASYDWLNGTPATAGIQTEFSIYQTIDFPTAYGKKRKLAGLLEQRADIRETAARREVLLEAKQVCLTITHLNRLKSELQRRLASAEELERAAGKKLATGEGNAIDANRAKLFALGARTDLRTVDMTLEAEQRHLVALNGGQAIQYTDTVFPPLPDALPAVETLEPIIEAADPIDRELQGDVTLSEGELSLSRALALPDLEAGYRYQSLLGQEFNGFHAGISLPLWEHKNTVKLRKLEVTATNATLLAHRNEHRQKVQHLYATAAAALANLHEYRDAWAALPDRSLLERAFISGELSAVQYQMELANYYAAQDRLMELEHEAQRTVAELYAHEL